MIWFVDEKDWLGRQVKKKVYKKIKKNGKTIETLDPNFFGGGMYTLHKPPEKISYKMEYAEIYPIRIYILHLYGKKLKCIFLCIHRQWCRLENTHHPHQIVALDLNRLSCVKHLDHNGAFDLIICRQYSMNANRSIVAFLEHLPSFCIVYTLVLQHTSNIRSNVYSNARYR